MKTKTIILLGAAALVTLSFTFANVSKQHKSVATSQQKSTQTEPVGGFAAEELVK